MKSYYLYFVLLVFCSSKCCGWDYQGDDYISTGKEVIYLLEGTNGNPIIFHSEVYDRINTCDDAETVANPMFFDIYSFRDTTNKNSLIDLDVLLYSQYENELLEILTVDAKSPPYRNIEDRFENTFYQAIWQKMTYKKFEEKDSFVIKIFGVNYKNDSAFINGTYNLSPSNKMNIKKNYDLSGNIYSDRIRIDLLKSRDDYRRLIRIKSLNKLNDYRSLSIYMNLYENINDSSVFISKSAYLAGYGIGTSAFLNIPNSKTSFDGYIEIKQPYKDFDSTMLTIPIRF